jgi:hypothetical protein
MVHTGGKYIWVTSTRPAECMRCFASVPAHVPKVYWLNASSNVMGPVQLAGLDIQYPQAEHFVYVIAKKQV